MKCIIVGAGDFDVQRMTVGEDDFLIAADGGYTHLLEQKIQPHLLIGDMDSISAKAQQLGEKQNNIEILQLPREKDDTDTLAAIRVGLEKGYKEFEIYGALGGRMDHTIANLQCLLYLKKREANGVIVEENTMTMLLHNEKITFPASMKGMISVFAFGKDAMGVTEKGLKYEVENVTITQEFPIGVSNEFMGEKSEIEVKDGILLIHIIRNV